MADLDSGEPRPTRECLGELIATLGPVASRLGSEPALRRALALLTANGAIAQRAAAARGGPRAVAQSLCDRFLEPLPG